MSKKVVIVSVVLLVFGGASIPGGIYLNNYISEMTYNSVDEGLLGIKDFSIPMISQMVKESGVAEALRQIKAESVPIGIELTNASIWMMILSMIHDLKFTIMGVDFLEGEVEDHYWNGPFKILTNTYEFSYVASLSVVGYPPIPGIGEWCNHAYYFNETARANLMYGVPDRELPGICTDSDASFGLLDFLDLYDDAVGDSNAQNALANGYECEWDNLTTFVEYYRNCVIPEVIPMIINDLNDSESTLYEEIPEYRNLTLDEISYYNLLRQWINCTIYDDGLDFHDFVDSIPEGTTGFEVNGLDPSGISIEAAQELWNKSNTHAIVNMDSMEVWVEAKNHNSPEYTLLLDEFSDSGLTIDNLNMILDWMWCPEGFSDRMVPILLESDMGFSMSLEDFSIQLLLEQWANGTTYGEAKYPDGFPLPLKGGIRYGFEVGVPNPTNMSKESALALWNESSKYSLVSKAGIFKWFSAVKNDSEAYNILQIENMLTDHAMDLLLEWLPDFQYNIMPYLAQHQYNLPTDSITFGNIIQIGGIAIGGTMISLSMLCLIGNVRAKRKRAEKRIIPKMIANIDKKNVPTDKKENDLLF